MQNPYEEIITIHRAFIQLHGLQQQRRDFVKSDVQDAIVTMKEWKMRYKGEPLSK